MKAFAAQLIEAVECLGVPRAAIDHLLRAQKEILLALQAVIECGVTTIDDLLKREEGKSPVSAVD